MIRYKVTLLDGSTKEYETWGGFDRERILLPYTLMMISLLM